MTFNKNRPEPHRAKGHDSRVSGQTLIEPEPPCTSSCAGGNPNAGTKDRRVDLEEIHPPAIYAFFIPTRAPFVTLPVRLF